MGHESGAIRELVRCTAHCVGAGLSTAAVRRPRNEVRCHHQLRSAAPAALTTGWFPENDWPRRSRRSSCRAVARLARARRAAPPEIMPVYGSVATSAHSRAVRLNVTSNGPALGVLAHSKSSQIVVRRSRARVPPPGWPARVPEPSNDAESCVAMGPAAKTSSSAGRIRIHLEVLIADVAMPTSATALSATSSCCAFDSRPRWLNMGSRSRDRDVHDTEG